MEIVPISFKVARQFIDGNHRHHHAPQGMKFCVGLMDDEGISLAGVAIAGRPVSYRLDDGRTIEITRVCTKGEKNACSMLYGACCRAAKAMGYRKAITYTLESEDGASLRASNFRNCGTAGGKHWTGKRNKGQDIPAEMKTRWERELI